MCTIIFRSVLNIDSSVLLHHTCAKIKICIAQAGDGTRVLAHTRRRLQHLDQQIRQCRSMHWSHFRGYCYYIQTLQFCLLPREGRAHDALIDELNVICRMIYFCKDFYGLMDSKQSQRSLVQYQSEDLLYLSLFSNIINHVPYIAIIFRNLMKEIKLKQE